jgi:hypothetical protein
MTGDPASEPAQPRPLRDAAPAARAPSGTVRAPAASQRAAAETGSVPAGEPAGGQVTFRVPVDAFEPVLRELKALGTYREELSGSYVDGPRDGGSSIRSTHRARHAGGSNGWA